MTVLSVGPCLFILHSKLRYEQLSDIFFHFQCSILLHQLYIMHVVMATYFILVCVKPITHLKVSCESHLRKKL